MSWIDTGLNLLGRTGPTGPAGPQGPAGQGLRIIYIGAITGPTGSNVCSTVNANIDTIHEGGFIDAPRNGDGAIIKDLSGVFGPELWIYYGGLTGSDDTAYCYCATGAPGNPTGTWLLSSVITAIQSTGPTGRSSTGPTGYTGYTGQCGYTGYTGPTGPGYTGPTGWTGPTGSTGRTGFTGYTGPTGYGPTGQTGPTGSTGYLGPAGVTGVTGIRGTIIVNSTGPPTSSTYYSNPVARNLIIGDYYIDVQSGELWQLQSNTSLNDTYILQQLDTSGGSGYSLTYKNPSTGIVTNLPAEAIGQSNQVYIYRCVPPIGATTTYTFTLGQTVSVSTSGAGSVSINSRFPNVNIVYCGTVNPINLTDNASGAIYIATSTNILSYFSSSTTYTITNVGSIPPTVNVSLTPPMINATLISVNQFTQNIGGISHQLYGLYLCIAGNFPQEFPNASAGLSSSILGTLNAGSISIYDSSTGSQIIASGQVPIWLYTELYYGGIVYLVMDSTNLTTGIPYTPLTIPSTSGNSFITAINPIVQVTNYGVNITVANNYFDIYYLPAAGTGNDTVLSERVTLIPGYYTSASLLYSMILEAILQAISASGSLLGLFGVQVSYTNITNSSGYTTGNLAFTYSYVSTALQAAPVFNDINGCLANLGFSSSSQPINTSYSIDYVNSAGNDVLYPKLGSFVNSTTSVITSGAYNGTTHVSLLGANTIKLTST